MKCRWYWWLEKEVKVQNAQRAREEESLVYSCNQGPNEDEVSDENQSCFQETLNVYMSDASGKDIWQIYISKRRGSDPIDLLLLSDGKKSHYTWIKDFNALLNYDYKHPKQFWPYCLHGFDNRYIDDEKMKAHMDDCFTYGGQRVELPEGEKNEIKFKDIAKQQQLPFCIIADFESLLPKFFLFIKSVR